MSYVSTPWPVGGTVSLPPPPRVRGWRHMTFQTRLAKACRLWWSTSYGSWLCLFTKGGCVTSYYFILFMMLITRPFSPRNLRNYLWMTKPQFRVKQIVTQALYQTLKTTKKNLKRLSGKEVFKTTIAIRFNLLQVCPTMPTFVFSALLIPSFNVLSSYFHFSLNLVTDFTVWILTQPLQIYLWNPSAFKKLRKWGKQKQRSFPLLLTFTGHNFHGRKFTVKLIFITCMECII